MLRKLSEQEEKTMGRVREVRDEAMRGMDVEDPKELTLDQIERISDRVKVEVPEHAEIVRKNLEAFQTRKRIESEGRLN
jgi:hypothetical protein